MWGLVTGIGHWVSLLAVLDWAGLRVVTVLSAYSTISCQSVSGTSTDDSSCSTLGAAMLHHGHEGCHDAATQIAASSL